MGFLVSLFAGPFAGILGSIISAGTSYFERKQKAEERAAEMAHEVKLQEMNIAARGQEMENEALIAHTNAVAQQLEASYGHDASYGPVSASAATVLRFVRPALTFLLIGLVALIYFTMPEAQIVDDSGAARDIGELIVLKVMFLAEASVTWWFLDRRRSNK